MRQIKLKFADERVSYTHSFERYVVGLSRLMTMQDIAKHLNDGWGMVKEIQKRYPAKRYAKPIFKNLILLAVDEIAIAKGHSYLTVILDLESGAIVFVGDGKGADASTPFFEQ